MSMKEHNQPLQLNFSEEQGMLLDSAREFCRSRSDIFAVRALLEHELGYNESVWQEMADLGWLGVAVPEQYGGAELGIGSAVPIVECMGKALLSTPYISSTLVSQALLRGGSQGQKETFVPTIVEGTVAALATLENEDWGDEGVTVTASSDGSDLILSGIKTQVSDAAAAQLFLVSVLAEGQQQLLLVPASALSDNAIRPDTLIDETRRSARVDFTGARVSQENLLPGDFATVMRDIRLLGALLMASESTGSAAACMDVTVEYLKTRKQFGRLIGSYQALKHPMVDILCAIDSAKSFIYHAASVLGENALDETAEAACRMAKAQSVDALKFAGDRAVQFHGGMGFTYECDAQLYIRRAQWSQQAFGDAAHQRKRLAVLLLDS